MVVLRLRGDSTDSAYQSSSEAGTTIIVEGQIDDGAGWCYVKDSGGLELPSPFKKQEGDGTSPAVLLADRTTALRINGEYTAYVSIRLQDGTWSDHREVYFRRFPQDSPGQPGKIQQILLGRKFCEQFDVTVRAGSEVRVAGFPAERGGVLGKQDTVAEVEDRTSERGRMLFTADAESGVFPRGSMVEFFEAQSVSLTRWSAIMQECRQSGDQFVDSEGGLIRSVQVSILTNYRWVKEIWTVLFRNQEVRGWTHVITKDPALSYERDVGRFFSEVSTAMLQWIMCCEHFTPADTIAEVADWAIREWRQIGVSDKEILKGISEALWEGGWQDVFGGISRRSSSEAHISIDIRRGMVNGSMQCILGNPFKEDSKGKSAAARFAKALRGEIDLPPERYRDFDQQSIAEFEQALDLIRDKRADLHCSSACKRSPEFCHGRVLEQIAGSTELRDKARAALLRAIPGGDETRERDTAQVMSQRISDGPDDAKGDRGEIDLKLVPVEVEIPQSLDQEIYQMCKEIEAEGWFPVDAAPGFLMRLRPISKEEHHDTEAQQWRFAIRFPEIPARRKAKASTGAFTRSQRASMSSDDGEWFDQNIQEYVDKKWWYEISEDDELPQGALPAVDCFGVFPVNHRRRLVVNTVGVNRSLPKVSSAVARSSDIIVTQLLTTPNEGCRVDTDASSAFLRIELDGVALIIWAGSRKYVCTRLQFGLSVGPAGLQAALGGLEKRVRTRIRKHFCKFRAEFAIFLRDKVESAEAEDSDKSLAIQLISKEAGALASSLYVDDLPVGGDPVEVAMIFVCHNKSWSVTGFTCFYKKFVLSCSARIASGVNLIFSVLGVKTPAVTESVLLGCPLSFDTSLGIKVDCGTQSRWKVAIEMIDEALRQGGMSRRTAFAIAGMGGHDPCALHGDVRILCDLVRRIWGRVRFEGFSRSQSKSKDWDIVKKFDELEPGPRLANRHVLEGLKKLLLESECNHQAPPRKEGQTGVLEIALLADASREGAGFEVRAGFCSSQDSPDSLRVTDPELVQQFGTRVRNGGVIWSKVERGYHSNRRELKIALLGLQATAHLVGSLAPLAPDSASVHFDVFIQIFRYSDNKSVVSWTTDEGLASIDRSSAVEKRSVGRLLEAIREEVGFLERCGARIGPMRHLPGQANEYADYISRLASTPLYPFKTLWDAIDQSDLLETIPEEEDEAESTFALGERRTEFPEWLREAVLAGASFDWTLNAMRYVEHLRSDEISMDSIKAVDEESTLSISLGDGCANASWDLLGCLRRVRRLHILFLAWRSGAEVSMAQWEECPDEMDHLRWIRSIQIHDVKFWEQKKKEVEGPGPIQIHPDLEVLVEVFPGAGGVSVWRFPIPKSAKGAASLLIRDAHRKTQHGGAVRVLQELRGYSIPRAKSAATALRRRCLYCQIAAAKPVWYAAPAVAWDDRPMELMIRDAPFTVFTTDFVELGEKNHRLSLTCALTGYTSWYHCTKERADEVIMALRTAQAEHGSLKILCADRASYFRSGEMERRVGELGIRIKPNPPRSPWTIGGEERLHGVVKQALRSAIRHVEGRLALLSVAECKMFEAQILRTVNSRPLGGVLDFGADDGPAAVTPELLALGYKRSNTALHVTDQRPVDLLEAAYEARRKYYSLVFPELRRAVGQELQRRFGDFQGEMKFKYGDAVLVRFQNQRALQQPWRLGHVVGFEPQRDTEVGQDIAPRKLKIAMQGKVSTEHHFNVIPLHRDTRPGLEIPLNEPNRSGQYIAIKLPVVRKGQRGRPNQREQQQRADEARWWPSKVIWQFRSGKGFMIWIRSHMTEETQELLPALTGASTDSFHFDFDSGVPWTGVTGPFAWAARSLP